MTKVQLQCPKCSTMFNPPVGTKEGDTVQCPKCLYSNIYHGVEIVDSLEELDHLTPYQESQREFNELLIEHLEEDQKLASGGYDYGGKAKWKSLMRSLGRLDR